MATERDYFHDLAEDLVHGAEESYVADLSEEMLDLLEQGMASEDRWAVMAMRCREAALGVWARHRNSVTSQTERAFTRALEREDEAIVSSLASEFSAPAGLTNRAANEVMEASRGLAEIISRQNVALADNLADTWWRVTADAVTRTQLGDDPRDVMEDAVSFLSKAGLETIDYRSGQKTSIDAAVRRHTVTQANQCRNDMLVRQCEAYEVDLVFTSAHWGCRPTHAEWQGKPFSLHGTVEVDGVVYRDLAEATGYGTVQGLCGANCRHRLTPYIPGLSKLPDTDFKAFEEKYHMTSEEYYQATQRQRALERQVRATKREIALGQERGLDMTEARYRLGAQQKRLREHCAMTGLPRDGERERAYGVKAQPRALTSKKAYPVGSTPVKNGRRVFPTIRGDHDMMSDLLAVNPRYQSDKAAGKVGHTQNCQRCAITYELRRRGYDVVAKPTKHEDPKDDPIASSWWTCFIGGSPRQCGSGNGKEWIEHYASKWEPGYRAIVSVQWKESDVGHAFIAEMTGNGLVFLDPQSGEYDVSRYFDQVEDGQTFIMRTDRLKPSKKVDDCCTTRSKGGKKRWSP